MFKSLKIWAFHRPATESAIAAVLDVLQIKIVLRVLACRLEWTKMCANAFAGHGS